MQYSKRILVHVYDKYNTCMPAYIHACVYTCMHAIHYPVHAACYAAIYLTHDLIGSLLC